MGQQLSGASPGLIGSRLCPIFQLSNVTGEGLNFVSIASFPAALCFVSCSSCIKTLQFTACSYSDPYSNVVSVVTDIPEPIAFERRRYGEVYG